MDAILMTAWDALVNTVFTIFTQPTGQLFASLLRGWILCTGRHTVTGMLRALGCDARRAHDAYHRFFPDARWHTAELWRRLVLLLVRRFCPGGTIILDLDDTLFHRSGRKVEGAGWWCDAVRSTGSNVVYAWGLNLVVLTLRVHPPWGGEPLSLPINMRRHRKTGDNLIELAEAMLRQTAQWLPDRQFIACADGFYASLVGKGIERVEVISRLRRNAILYDLPPTRPHKKRGRPRKRGDKLAAPKRMASHEQKWRKVKTCERDHRRQRLVYVRTVLWHKVSKVPVLLVISRDPAGKEKDDFFVCTDTTLTAAEVVSLFAGRWSIEDTFKNTKQLLGCQEPQTRKGRGPERSATLGL